MIQESTKEPGLIEYLFIDTRKLDTYFEQFSLPLTYDKIPIWKAVLGLAGPKAEVTQNRVGRPFTEHEKITRFRKHLKKKRLLLNGRPETPFNKDTRREQSERVFRTEAMSARCGILPLSESTETKVWVSPAPNASSDRIGALFLIEEYPSSTKVELWTGYSSLIMLLQALGDVSSFGRDMFATVDRIESEFGRDPIGSLSSLGVRFGPEREIEATYRIRACCMATENGGATTTVGYPIVISAR